MVNVIDAVKDGDTRILGLLMQVPQIIPEREQAHALLTAVRTNNLDCAKILLEANVGTKATDSQGNTLVKVASENGNAEMLQLLLESGCPVNIRNSSGATALHYAAKYGKKECVKLLLEEGAKLNYLDSGGNTPLLLAAKNCYETTQVIKVLVAYKECQLNVRDNEGRTALHYCCHEPSGGEILLKAGADPNVQDDGGNTPILMAATEGLDHVIGCLLAYGCNPDIMNNYKKAAIHILAMKNHPEAIGFICLLGGSCDLIDGSGNTALWYAVNHNRPEAVKMLLQANCSIEPVRSESGDIIGGNPLQTALDKSLYGIAKLLILAGCELSPLYRWISDREARIVSQTRERMVLFEEDRDSESEDEDELDAVDWFQDWLHRPHTLKQCCRIFIRRQIGNTLHMSLAELPLPKVLQDYVLLKEVEDHPVDGELL